MKSFSHSLCKVGHINVLFNVQQNVTELQGVRFNQLNSKLRTVSFNSSVHHHPYISIVSFCGLKRSFSDVFMSMLQQRNTPEPHVEDYAFQSDALKLIVHRKPTGDCRKENSRAV